MVVLRALTLALILVVAACGSTDEDTGATSAVSPPVETDAATPTTDASSSVVDTRPSTPSTEEAIATEESSPTSEPAKASVLAIELVECDRFGIGSPADPAAARRYVPDAHDLFLVQDHAVFTLQALSCRDLVTDGTSHGPGHFSTAWIRIIRPDELQTPPRESGLATMPPRRLLPAAVRDGQ